MERKKVPATQSFDLGDFDKLNDLRNRLREVGYRHARVEGADSFTIWGNSKINGAQQINDEFLYVNTSATRMHLCATLIKNALLNYYEAESMDIRRRMVELGVKVD